MLACPRLSGDRRAIVYTRFSARQCQLNVVQIKALCGRATARWVFQCGPARGFPPAELYAAVSDLGRSSISVDVMFVPSLPNGRLIDAFA